MFPILYRWRLAIHEGDPDGTRQAEAAIWGDDPREWVEMPDGKMLPAPSWWREDRYQAGMDTAPAEMKTDMIVRHIEVKDVAEAWEWVLGDDVPAAAPVRPGSSPDEQAQPDVLAMLAGADGEP